MRKFRPTHVACALALALSAGTASAQFTNAYAFGDSLFDPTGRPSQKVTIQGMDGKTYEAIYFMERQPDGTWLIAGCVLVLIPGTNV